MFLFIYLSCVSSKQNTPSANQSNTSIKTEQQTETESPVDSSGFPFKQLHCATNHIDRSLKITGESDSPTLGSDFPYTVQHRAGVYMFIDGTVSNEKVQIRYGDLYVPFDVEESNLERSILIEGLDISNDLSKIVWKQSLDRYPRPNKISNTADRYIFGEISIDVSGGNGFYTGHARFSESEIDISVSCWTDGLTDPFIYNEGKCQNKEGNEGYNPWSLEMVRVTRNGECSNLEGQELNDGFYNYPVLNWNLKGANLNGADVTFSNFYDVQLEGAKFDTMTMGYVRIRGSIDTYTKYGYSCEIDREPTKIKCAM